jgi:hypothetical protein
MRMRIALASTCAALLLAACAGTDFVRPTPDQLRLGATTKEDVLKQFGDPRSKGSAIVSGESVDSVSYAYAAVGAEAYSPGVTGARSVEFVFWKDRLVGHQFNSSMKADATYFPKDKAAQVKQGMTRQQVLQLMGEPSGRAVYPVISERDGEGLLYQYVEVRGFTPHQRKLVVELDAQGRVTKSTFSAQGESPAP